MKVLSMLFMLALLMGYSKAAFCDANALALASENVTKAPFMMLKEGNEGLFPPVKEVNRPVIGFTNNVRAAAISVGLNLGQAVE